MKSPPTQTLQGLPLHFEVKVQLFNRQFRALSQVVSISHLSLLSLLFLVFTSCPVAQGLKAGGPNTHLGALWTFQFVKLCHSFTRCSHCGILIERNMRTRCISTYQLVENPQLSERKNLSKIKSPIEPKVLLVLPSTKGLGMCIVTVPKSHSSLSCFDSPSLGRFHVSSLRVSEHWSSLLPSPYFWVHQIKLSQISSRGNIYQEFFVRLLTSYFTASRQNRGYLSALSARSHLSYSQKVLQQVNKGNVSPGWQWLGRRGEQAWHSLWRCRPRSPRPSLFQVGLAGTLWGEPWWRALLWGQLQLSPSWKNCLYFLRKNWDSWVHVSLNAARIPVGWAKGLGEQTAPSPMCTEDLS